jgi:hypothetical protein
MGNPLLGESIGNMFDFLVVLGFLKQIHVNLKILQVISAKRSGLPVSPQELVNSLEPDGSRTGGMTKRGYSEAAHGSKKDLSAML